MPSSSSTPVGDAPATSTKSADRDGNEANEEDDGNDDGADNNEEKTNEEEKAAAKE